MKRILVVLITLGLQFSVFAKGKIVGNGGDEIGLEFQSLTLMALEHLKIKSPETYESLPVSRLISLAKTAQYFVVDNALDVQVKSIIQNSIATNIAEKNAIYINRARWSQIQNPVLKTGIAFHEVLSLAKLEQTGSYPISGEYVTLMGARPSELKASVAVNTLAQISAVKPTAKPYEIFKNLYESSIAPAAMNDFDKHGEHSNMRCAEAFVSTGGEAVGSSGRWMQADLILVPKKPSYGPLIPAEPAQVQTLLANTNNSISSELLQPQLRTTKIEFTPTDLVLNIVCPKSGINCEQYGYPFEVNIRKQNGLISYFVRAYVGTAKESHYYGYCWRE